MIDVTDRRIKCFAYEGGECTVLIKTECNNCKFYKPADCEDWIRIDEEDKVVVIPPEEYEENFKRKEKKKNDKRARLFGKGVLY